MVGIIPDDRLRREGGRCSPRCLHEAAGGSVVGHRRPRRRSSSGRCSPRRTASASSGVRSGRRRTPTARRCRAPSGPTRRSASSAHPSSCRRSRSSPASPRRCSTSPSPPTPTRRRPRRPASPPPRAPRASRAVARARARAVDLARHDRRRASLVFCAHGATGVDAAAMLPVHGAPTSTTRALRGIARLSVVDDELHPARLAAGLRRHDLRRVRRRRGHGAARRQRVAGAARRVPDARCSSSSRRS